MVYREVKDSYVFVNAWFNKNNNYRIVPAESLDISSNADLYRGIVFVIALVLNIESALDLLKACLHHLSNLSLYGPAH